MLKARRSARAYQMSMVSGLLSTSGDLNAHRLRGADGHRAGGVAVIAALVAGRFHEAAARPTQQVIDASLQQAGAIVRAEVVPLAHVDDHRPVETGRLAEDVGDGVEGAGRIAHRFRGDPVGHQDDVRFGRHADEGEGGQAVARNRAVPRGDARHVRAVPRFGVAIGVAHHLRRAGRGQHEIDVGLGVFNAVGVAGRAVLRAAGDRGEGLVPDAQDAAGAVLAPEALMLPIDPRVDDAHDHARAAVSGRPRVDQVGADLGNAGIQFSCERTRTLNS